MPPCSSCAEIDFELGGDRWTMMRGDFANLPPGTPHGWTMRSEGAQIALFSMNHRVGAAFTAMGERQEGPQVPTGAPAEISAAALRGELPRAISSLRPPLRPQRRPFGSRTSSCR